MRKRIPSQTIGFRASEELLKLIDHARQRFGVSRGEWARGIISAELYSEERESVSAQLENLQKAINFIVESSRSQNRKLATTLFTILTEIGQLDTDSAKALVKRRILDQEPQQ